MWQLKLLSQVLPAFAALAKEFSQSPNEDLQRDAEQCWSDIVNIGLAVSESRGEWASHFDDKVVTDLLEALNSRVPKKKSWLQRITPKEQPVCFMIVRVILVVHSKVTIRMGGKAMTSRRPKVTGRMGGR